MRLVRIYGVGDFLIAREGEDVPEDIPDNITVLKQPLDTTYLVSTSVMDLVRAIGALDSIRLAGLDADDWYISEASERIRSGSMLYAGKYRAPDYELILSLGCDLAIENTMIYHDPEVKEKLEELGIPVLVETSSYESDPLGRLEWVKVYGALFSKEKEAEDLYNEQAKKIKSLTKDAPEEATVAMFYATTSGMINVRAPGDYITKMITIAGGRYVPDEKSAGKKSGMGTVNMQMEDFYKAAKDADILIYNATIEGDVKSVSDILAVNDLFADMKAVKDGNVYCLNSDYFQKTTGMADLIADFAAVIDNDDSKLVFLTKLE